MRFAGARLTRLARSIHLSTRVLGLLIMALVMELLATAQADLQLGPTAPEIESHRDQRIALSRDLADQALNLLLVQQQLTGPQRVVILPIGLLIRRYMDIHQKRLTVFQPNVTLGDRDPPTSQRLHLRTKQNQTRLDRVLDVESMTRLLIDRNGLDPAFS